MPLDKRENIVSRIFVILSTLSGTPTVIRRIGDIQDEKEDIVSVGSQVVILNDDDQVVDELMNREESNIINLSITKKARDITSTQANVFIAEVKEKIYNDSVLHGLSKFIKFGADRKRSVLEHNYVVVQIDLTIEYDEKVFVG
jgi:lipopolysaccharide export system protein LptA